jgi:hypothetical protein
MPHSAIAEFKQLDRRAASSPAKSSNLVGVVFSRQRRPIRISSEGPAARFTSGWPSPRQAEGSLEVAAELRRVLVPDTMGRQRAAHWESG